MVEGLLVQQGAAREAVERWRPLIELLPQAPPGNHLVLLEPAPERDDRVTLQRSALLRALRALPDVDAREFPELRP